MERLGLVWLFAVVLPGLAHPQRVEVAVFVGGYVALPNIREGYTGIDCIRPPCPTYFHTNRQGGTMLGGRAEVDFGAGLAVGATFEFAEAGEDVVIRDGAGGAVMDQVHRQVAETFLSVQTSRRFRLAELVSARIGVGSVAVNRATQHDSNLALGLACSGAVRLQVERVALEVRTTWNHLAGRHQRGSRNHITSGAGVVFALRQ